MKDKEDHDPVIKKSKLDSLIPKAAKNVVNSWNILRAALVVGGAMLFVVGGGILGFCAVGAVMIYTSYHMGEDKDSKNTGTPSSSPPSPPSPSPPSPPPGDLGASRKRREKENSSGR